MEGRRPVVIIGAGLGGLALGIRLAAQGFPVRIFEQSSQPGGKMNRLREGGFTFDTGPSLITMPNVFEHLFHDVGLTLADHLRLLPVRPYAEYVLSDGGSFTHTPNLTDWLATVRRFEGGQAEGFLRVMDTGARLFELSRHTFLARSPRERPVPPPVHLLRRAPWREGFGNYASFIRRHIRSDALRRFFLRYPTYVGSNPYRTPSTLAVVPWLEYAFGAWHIEGGLYRLVETLVREGERLGMDVQTGARVERITTRDGRVTGVELAHGPAVPADALVMNGDASALKALLDPGHAQPLPESHRSLSGFMLLYGLPRRLQGQAHHRVFFSSSYETEFADLFDRRVFPDDPTVYVNLPARTDPAMAPAGGETVFVMANAPANDADTWGADEMAHARQRVLARLTRAGLPDLESEAVVRNVWTPRRLADTYAMPGGAIYGEHSHGFRHAFLRPPNRHPRIRGLYAVGGSTHPGGGTPTVLMSAAITHRLMMEDMR